MSMYENHLTRWKGLRKTIWWKSIWSDSTIPDEKGPAYNFCSRSRSHFELATVQTLMEKNESTVRQCPPFFNQALTRIHCGNLICWRAIWLTGKAEIVVQEASEFASKTCWIKNLVQEFSKKHCFSKLKISALFLNSTVFQGQIFMKFCGFCQFLKEIIPKNFQIDFFCVFPLTLMWWKMHNKAYHEIWKCMIIEMALFLPLSMN